ncbi:MAG: hypothetical protein QW217_07825, partial [Candidatus Caldarchaeum sp.]
MPASSTFGGIPLYGYRDKILEVHATRQNKLTIYEYDLSLPPLPATSDSFPVKEGRNVFDLSSFSGVVSFRLDEADPRGFVRMYLS